MIPHPCQPQAPPGQATHHRQVPHRREDHPHRDTVRRILENNRGNTKMIFPAGGIGNDHPQRDIVVGDRIKSDITMIEIGAASAIESALHRNTALVVEIKTRLAERETLVRVVRIIIKPLITIEIKTDEHAHHTHSLQSKDRVISRVNLQDRSVFTASS